MNPIPSVRRVPLALATACVLAWPFASAQAVDRIVGVWQSEVERINCATGDVTARFLGIQTVHANGTLSDTNSTDPSTRGPGMGVWERRGDVVESRFRFQLFGGGQFMGTAVVTRTMVLDEDRASGVATSTTEVLAPNGVVVATGCARDVSVKID